jgi:hypothetical protein
LPILKSEIINNPLDLLASTIPVDMVELPNENELPKADEKIDDGTLPKI